MVLRWDYTRRRRNAHRHVLGIRSLVARRTRVDQSRGCGHRPRPRLCVVAKARQVVFAHGRCGDCGRPGKIGAMLSGPTETAGRKATKRLESPAIAVVRSGCRMPVTWDHPLCQLWDHSERRPKMSSQADPLPERPPRAEWVDEGGRRRIGRHQHRMLGRTWKPSARRSGRRRTVASSGHGRVAPGLPDQGSVPTAPGEAGPEAVLPYNLPYKSRQLPSSGISARLQLPCSDRVTPSGAVQKNPSGRIISAAL